MVSAIAPSWPPQSLVVLTDDWEEMREELDAEPPQPVVGDYRNDHWVLSTVIPEVLAYAVRYGRATSTREVSQRQFNRARAGANHPGCPTAKGLNERWGLGWQGIKELAHRDSEAISRTLAGLKPLLVEVDEDVIDARVDDVCSRYINELTSRGVSEEEARQTVLTRDVYTRISDERRADAKRHKNGVPMRWPTISQIDRRGGLTAALKRLGRPHEHPPKAPPRSGRSVWTREEKVEALVRFMGKRRMKAGGVQRGYTAWRAKQDDPYQFPPHSSFVGDDALSRILRFVYEAQKDPAILDGPLILEDDKGSALRQRRTGDPLLDAFVLPGGQHLLDTLHFVAAHDGVSITEMAAELGDSRTGQTKRALRLVELKAIEGKRDRFGKGRPMRYRATERGREAIELNPTTFAPRRTSPPSLTPERRQLLEIIARLGDGATRAAIGEKINVTHPENIKQRCEALVRMELVERDRDPNSSRSRVLYRLTDKGRAELNDAASAG